MAISAAAAPTSTREKPRLSFWQIWNMSFGFLGIQFGFELQNSNVSRIFETLGANKDDIPILWIAAPVTGLLVQPVIGYLSDRTWSPRFGRRRPFFLIGALLASLALLVMPNSSALWMAGGMLWIMDASINISMEPFRAFVGDKLPSEQRTSGFAMQSFFIGVGSVIAALLPWVFTNWLGMSNTAPAGEIPPSVKWAFYVGAAAFLLSVLYTVFTSTETPPEDMEAFRAENAKVGMWDGLRESFAGIFHMPAAMRQLAVVQFFTWFALFSMWIYATNAVTSNIYNMRVDAPLYEKLKAQVETNEAQAAAVAKVPGEEDRSVIEKVGAFFSEMFAPTSPEKRTWNELKSLKKDVAEIDKFQADKTDKVISLNMASYAVDKAQLTEQDKATAKRVQQQYNDGADWLSLCSSVRNGVAAVFAFIIPLIAARTSRRRTHMLCLLLGGIGLVSLKFITNPDFIIVSMSLVGIAWASILSMPYAILAGSLPANRMGYYMGVFNFFIVIPQIVAATILGWFTVNIFQGNTLNTLVLGGVSMVLAGLLTLRVRDDDDTHAAAVMENPGYDTPVLTNPQA
ncbi:maltose/moltooligosaccharide transporter [Hymenobacter luteus]|uniref:Maltose/moltooligosaccharide transporter n=2 Tax=Hymenobacter TaxID=89966 RepID=A0A7W9T5B7_9BACT|nr:MFS transporter [Hymenobacter latericoloratus]MBB4603318.1 maltose/moltooligosaccharide transporter [Hymenobacter latericoloratus]MBB6061124.1 maltose/moltooligosaccharide transporter [Hymenobacter luteus]